jgi:cellulose synthase operon protein C
MRAILWIVAVAVTAAALPAAPAQEKAAASSSSEAVLAYRDAANFQNNGAFEVAAEEWQRFLKNFPKDPLAAKAQHYLGVCQLQLKQYPAAAASLEAAAKNHPDFELLEETLFDLASCQYAMAAGGQMELYAKAAATFEDVVKRFPKGKHVEESLFYQGEALYAQGKKADAIKPYERLVKEFDSSKRRADALYALGVAQEETEEHAEAGKTYDTYLREFSNSPLANEVRLRKAETLLKGGDLGGAERLFAQLAEAKDFKQADHALSRQAFCLAKMDKLEAAGAAYARLEMDFGQSPSANDAAISAGRCYYRANQLEAAQQWLRKAIDRRDENSTEAAHWLCKLLIKTGTADEAAELAAKELPAASGPFAFNLALDQADALYETETKRPDALALYVKFIDAYPRHDLAPQALYNAAFTALGLKQYETGRQHAGTFLDRFPAHELSADVRYVAAECNLQLKEYESAEKLYRQLVDQHPQHADIDAWRVRLGLVAHLQKKHDAVIAALSPIVDSLKSADARAEAQFLIGASQFHANQFASAIQSLEASLKSSPKWRQADEALLLLARAQTKDGQSTKAKASLERLMAEFPASRVLDEAHYRLAEAYDGAEEYAAAAKEFDVVTATFSDSQFAPYALYGKGWAEYRSKSFANGTEAFTSFLSRFAEHQLVPDAQFGRALCRRQAGDFKGAIADIDSYLKFNPDVSRRSDALYERGLAQMSLKDYSGAVSTFERLLSTDSKYPAADKVLYEIGWALKSQDKNREAAAHFSKLAITYPDSKLAGEAWFHVGEDLYDGKQYAEAEKAYASVKPKMPDGELAEKATYKLGWSNFQQKNYADALVQFREQLAAFPSGPLAADATFMKAECLFLQEQYNDAWSAYQAALAVKPSTPTIEALTILHAGQSASQLKQWDDSISVLSQMAARQPESPLMAEALYELAWAKQNLDRTEEALTDYDAAASKSRDHVGARARFMRGELLFAQKKHDEASRDFQRAMYGYGGDQANAKTKNWQAKSGYEAGRCAEVQLSAALDYASKQKYLTDARRCYGFVAEKHPDHDLAMEAKKRLTALSNLEQQSGGATKRTR